MIQNQHFSNQKLNMSETSNKPMTNNNRVMFSLCNAPLTSISIPILRNNMSLNANAATSENLFNQNSSAESDLTELSWLTNSIQMFSKNSTLRNFFSDPIMSIETPPTPPPNTITPLSPLYTKQSQNISNSVNKIENKKILFNNRLKHQSNKVLISKKIDEETFYSSSSSSNSPLAQLNPKIKHKLNPLTKPDTKNQTNNKQFKHFVQIENSAKQDEINLDNLKFKNSCGLNKPPLTLSCLIFMALQESNDKCLPVREIYEWIEDNFPFYKNVLNNGWKSSIRHNLSFSKCFRKTEILGGLRNKSMTNEPIDLSTGRKRRASNNTGTCWTVSSDCKSFLVQTLKKSSFWFHNSKYYPNLSKFVSNYSIENNMVDNIENEVKFVTKRGRGMSKRLKIEKEINKLNSEDENMSEEEKQNNLIEFVQEQQDEILNKNATYYENHNRSSDNNKFDLSLSSSSLSSAFSQLSACSSTLSPLSSSSSSSSSDEPHNYQTNTSSINSDLEIEVASTLVGMKFLAARQHNKILRQIQKKSLGKTQN